MYYIFFGCSSLISLNLSNFDTSQVKDFGYMFSYCSSLTSLNLSNFDTSIVTNMNGMFYGCSLLTSLNLSNFNTSKVTGMSNMFSYCSSLTSLNLSNFNTSIVTNMIGMFYGCSSLTSLNLSNFNISKVTGMNYLFNGCIKLQYINLKNSLEHKSLSCSNMFYNVSKNIVICINETNNKIFSEISNNSCYINYCLDDWHSKQKKLIDGTEECIDNCENHTTNKFDYNGKCYQHCPYGKISINSVNQCKCELNKCLTCSSESLSKQFCTCVIMRQVFSKKKMIL